MGVPQRLENTHFLQDTLSIPDSQVFIDTELRHNPMWTWKQTMNLPVPEGTTHICLLQDDAVIPKHFKEWCEKMTDKYPEEIFALYNHKAKLPVPYGCVFTLKCNIGGVAMIIPVEYIPKIIETQERDYPDAIDDDLMVCTWAFDNGVRMLCPWPSIVDTGTDTYMEHVAKGKIHFCDDTEKYHWANATNFRFGGKKKK